MSRAARHGFFGKFTAPEDANMVANPGMADDGAPWDEVADTSSGMLWSYLNEGTINGVPVAQSDRNMKIDSEFMLQAAFTLVRRPKSLLVYLTPDDEDSKARYDEVLERAYAGEVVIVDEQKEFDTAHGRFVLWLRYDEVHYELHPRFRYLREE